MKIEPFIIYVTSKQSIIVQEIIFRNGYTWGDHSQDIQRTFGSYNLAFCGVKMDPICRLRFTNRGDKEHERITFKEFIFKYNLKEERKKKLDKLSNI